MTAGAIALLTGGAMSVVAGALPYADLSSWVVVQNAAPERQQRGQSIAPVNTIAEVFAAFRTCWRGPPEEMSRPGTEITIRFSFRRDGTMIGSPHLTFQTELTSEQRRAYFTAVSEALDRCLPLPLTPSFSEAIAGHPFVFRFVDDRNQKKAEYRT